MQLPLYDVARDRILSGSENDLDRFIVEHEPGGKAETEKFRRELADAVAFVETAVKVKCQESAIEMLADQQERHLFELHDQWESLTESKSSAAMQIGIAVGAGFVLIVWSFLILFRG